MKNTIYTTITLPLSQIKCDILEVSPPTMWRATIEWQNPNNKAWFDCGIFPHVLSNALLFNGERFTVEQISELAMDDYTAINQAFDLMYTKLKF